MAFKSEHGIIRHLRADRNERVFKESISKFKAPEYLRCDIVYCQRALRQYLKVHHILTDKFGHRIAKDSSARRVLIEIEQEIYEISQEQKSLCDRLRSCLDNYYHKLGIESRYIDTEIGNAFVARQLTRSSESMSASYIPCNVKARVLDKALVAKYTKILEHTTRQKHSENRKQKVQSIDRMQAASSSNSMAEPLSILGRKQVSLLKPKSERLPTQKSLFGCESSKSKNTLNGLKMVERTKPSPPTINSGRMNLLQALNKAKNENLAIQQKQQQAVSIVAKAASKTQRAEKRQTSSAPISSDESLEAPPTPPTPPPPPEENLVEQAHTNQESFMKLFNLYTPEYSAMLSQRRSKRRRRNVHSNEKKDYHYGNLDCYENSNKNKKKQFLHSPPATRNLKRKRNEEAIKSKAAQSTAKNVSDRSTSSSPVSKVLCMECGLNGDSGLTHCNTCKLYYHMRCHTTETSIFPWTAREKYCPNCIKIQTEETITNETKKQLKEIGERLELLTQNTELKRYQKDLWAEFSEYKQKLTAREQLKSKLQSQSQQIKIEMNNYLSFVNTCK